MSIIETIELKRMHQGKRENFKSSKRLNYIRSPSLILDLLSQTYKWQFLYIFFCFQQTVENYYPDNLTQRTSRNKAGSVLFVMQVFYISFKQKLHKNQPDKEYAMVNGHKKDNFQFWIRLSKKNNFNFG
jgi:hypothetical protein